MRSLAADGVERRGSSRGREKENTVFFSWCFCVIFFLSSSSSHAVPIERRRFRLHWYESPFLDRWTLAWLDIGTLYTLASVKWKNKSA